MIKKFSEKTRIFLPPIPNSILVGPYLGSSEDEWDESAKNKIKNVKKQIFEICIFGADDVADSVFSKLFLPQSLRIHRLIRVHFRQ